MTQYITIEAMKETLNKSKTFGRKGMSVLNHDGIPLFQLNKWLGSMLPKHLSICVLQPTTDEQTHTEVLIFTKQKNSDDRVIIEFNFVLKQSVNYINDHQKDTLKIEYGKVLNPRALAKLIKKHTR